MSAWFASLQKALPHHGISRLIGRLARSTKPLVRRTFIEGFTRAYPVDMSEAQAGSLDAYTSFNDFFTRALRPDARPIDADPRVAVSPADGKISQLGTIENGTLLQAKGHRYRLASLAGPLADGFDAAEFVTIYLAPSDYHRVHLPLAGELTDTYAVPGALFSVNAATEGAIEGLFCRNERLVCRFVTEHGPMLVVLVGAMIVASIETVWAGPASPYAANVHDKHHLSLSKGDEIGRFLLGSTVICCLPPGAVLTSITAGAKVRMGEALARIN